MFLCEENEGLGEWVYTFDPGDASCDDYEVVDWNWVACGAPMRRCSRSPPAR